MITLRSGRFGPYVQLGEGEKPKRASLPKGTDPASADLELGIKLLSLPREVGLHPESGKPIVANFGRYGPYVAHDGQFASLETPEDVFTVGLNHAVTLIAERKAKGFKRRGPEPLKELGAGPGGGAPIKLMKGRYGPYVTDGTTNATVPNGVEPMDLTLERAVELLAERAAKGPVKKKRNGAAKKEPKAKAKPEKAAPKKAPPKKKTAAKRKPVAVAGE
jgi:DNA topoisomerase-1